MVIVSSCHCLWLDGKSVSPNSTSSTPLVRDITWPTNPDFPHFQQRLRAESVRVGGRKIHPSTFSLLTAKICPIPTTGQVVLRQDKCTLSCDKMCKWRWRWRWWWWCFKYNFAIFHFWYHTKLVSFGHICSLIYFTGQSINQCLFLKQQPNGFSKRERPLDRATVCMLYISQAKAAGWMMAHGCFSTGSAEPG